MNVSSDLDNEEMDKTSYLGVDFNLSVEERLKVLNGKITIEGVAERMKNYKNIVVMTGAGISTNAGIPDFRSPGGFYETVDLKKYGLKSPEEMLSLNFFLKNPIPYYERAKKLLKAKIKPTKTHDFIVTLHKKGKLLRCYSQNIDSLEYHAGLPEEKLIQCHGRFRTNSCIQCGEDYDMKKFQELLFADKLPIICESCEMEKNYVKSDTVLFGEPLPRIFFTKFQEDFAKCDLLIVMGTSLKVQPVASLVNQVPYTCPRVLFDKYAVGIFEHTQKDGKYEKYNYRDVSILGDCDERTEEFIKLWKKHDTDVWNEKTMEKDEKEEDEKKE